MKKQLLLLNMRMLIGVAVLAALLLIFFQPLHFAAEKTGGAVTSFQTQTTTTEELVQQGVLSITTTYPPTWGSPFGEAGTLLERYDLDLHPLERTWTDARGKMSRSSFVYDNQNRLAHVIIGGMRYDVLEFDGENRPTLIAYNIQPPVGDPVYFKYIYMPVPGLDDWIFAEKFAGTNPTDFERTTAGGGYGNAALVDTVFMRKLPDAFIPEDYRRRTTTTSESYLEGGKTKWHTTRIEEISFGVEKRTVTFGYDANNRIEHVYAETDAEGGNPNLPGYGIRDEFVDVVYGYNANGLPVTMRVTDETGSRDYTFEWDRDKLPAAIRNILLQGNPLPPELVTTYDYFNSWYHPTTPMPVDIFTQ